MQEAPEDISVDHDGLPDVSVCSTETESSDVTLVNIAPDMRSHSFCEDIKESPQETVYWTARDDATRRKTISDGCGEHRKDVFSCLGGVLVFTLVRYSITN